MELQLLGTGEFLKPNRSFIIAIRHIDLIEKNKIMMKGGVTINIGETYRAQFFKSLKNSQVIMI